MANNPPGGPVAPGIAKPGQFPAWGVGGGTPGSAAGWNIKEAKNGQQQSALIEQGYVVWFSSDAAAKSFISSESSAYGSGTVPGLSGLAAIGDFFARLTQASTWIRLAEGVLGLVLIAVGVARITHAVPAATKIAGIAAKGALL